VAGAIWEGTAVWNTSKRSNVCTICRPRSIPPRLQVPVHGTMTSKQHTSSSPGKSMPQDLSSPGIGGFCNSLRPPSVKNVATLDISRTGTGPGISTFRPNQIRYTTVPRRRFQATGNTSRAAMELSSRSQYRCQILQRCTLLPVPVAATSTRGRS
jgi:hypothetical protein